MSLDAIEQRMYSDIVKVVNRTDSKLEFKHNSDIETFLPKEVKSMYRKKAEFAVSRLHTVMDSMTGAATESMLGIDEPNTEFPVTPLDVNPKEVAEAHKLDGDVVLSGQVDAPKTVVNLKGHKERFDKNN